MKETAEADEPEIYSVYNKICVVVGTGAMAVLKQKNLLNGGTLMHAAGIIKKNGREIIKL